MGSQYLIGLTTRSFGYPNVRAEFRYVQFYTLDFSEGLELAKNRRRRMFPITTVLHPKADLKLQMSAFRAMTAVVAGKAAVVRDGRLRQEMTHNGRR